MSRGWALVALSACALFGCNDAEAPATRCDFHDQCGDDYLCGPDGRCVPAAPCSADAACCPGAQCFNGWCRPTDTCDAARPCDGLGQACEAGQCAPAVCASDADCPGVLRCTAGRCIQGLPCGGACGDGTACHAASGRCLVAPSCSACADDRVAVVPEGAVVSNLACAQQAFTCVCAAPAPREAGLPGVDGQLVTLDSGPAVISYDPQFGDLVLSRFDAAGQVRQDVVLDGAAGDRGRRPAVAAVPGTLGPQLDIVYRDSDANGLAHVRYDPVNSRVVAQSRLPIDGDAGRYSCLAHVGTDARISGLAFVTSDTANVNARLVAFTAIADRPTSPAEWRIDSVLQTPLPPRSAAPCADACSFGELCVASAGSGQLCASLASFPAGCGTACGPLDACVRLSDGGAPTCVPRVQRLTVADALPAGAGGFVTCARGADGALVAAWYDPERRQLLASRVPSGAAPTVVDAGGAGLDVGRHADLSVSDAGTLAVAYSEAVSGSVRLAEAPGVAGPWSISTIHAPAPGEARDVGAWASVSATPGGGWLVAYADTVAGDIWLAHRAGSGGCWGRSVVLADGAFAFGDAVVRDDGAAWISALAYRFDAALAPRHAPIVVPSGLPACVGR